MSRSGRARERLGAIAIWLLVLASVALWPDAFVRWFLPKDALAAIAVVLAALSGARGRLPRWFVAASSVAAAIALTAVLLSAAPASQLWGRWPRYEGLVTLPVYFGAVWAGARVLGPGTDSAAEAAATAGASRTRTLVRAVAGAALLLGFVSVLEACGARPFPSDLARPGALTGNATDQGVLGALFLALLALPVLRAWAPHAAPATGGAASAARGQVVATAVTVGERAVLSAALVLSLATVVLSASRAGLVAAFVVLVTLSALELARLRLARRRTNSTEFSGKTIKNSLPTRVSGKKSVELVHSERGPGRGRALRIVVVAGGAVLFLVGGAFAVPFTRDRLLGVSPLSGSSLEARFAYWQQSIDALAGRPFGVGASGFLNANASASTWADTLDSPHNWIFQVLLAGGIPLLLVVLGIFVSVGVVGVRVWRRAAIGQADAARADVLAAAGAGLAGYGVALLTHFTAPSTTIVAGLLLGLLVSRAPKARTSSPRSSPAGSGPAVRRGVAGIRSGLLVLWAVWLVLLVGADVPLAAGVSAAARGDLSGAAASFERAQVLRPWDADLASIAAQSFAAEADAQVAGAAGSAVTWAERSRALLPGTVATERALAVGQLGTGDITGAEATLAALAALAPNDVAVAVQHAVVLYLGGDAEASGLEIRRALTLDPADPTALKVRDFLAGH
ncbi:MULTISPECIES: O-antigen ligase family protein [unclassified Cryobacterium]|uniref:O-antigen ligase family protein n=1 Tax=unclassified Cryobacterium TaxID=2649013 RepID=UPI002AB5D8E9|nr:MULTISPECIES: O-antigen ligase family protein [unclassified Cryobacterium]MDY7542563.1 O-antigen ligase family protein [Cryobacterium sp. 5B3]MEB0264684.1 O-antigen ligase family protein [Cryobacterium sp. 10I5]MEB0275158.1 O-antigen ligase family protein [Cryobacterium sp. 5B3]